MKVLDELLTWIASIPVSCLAIFVLLLFVEVRGKYKVSIISKRSSSSSICIALNGWIWLVMMNLSYILRSDLTIRVVSTMANVYLSLKLGVFIEAQ